MSSFALCEKALNVLMESLSLRLVPMNFFADALARDDGRQSYRS
jgi:hypothetical protein